MDLLIFYWLFALGFFVLLIYALIHQVKNRQKRDEREAAVSNEHQYSKIVYEYSFDPTVYFSDQKQKMIIESLLDSSKHREIKYSEILNCEILVDNATIQSGGLGRAVVGGIIAGGVGAIVGASTRKSDNVVNSLKIRIITANVYDALIEIPLIASTVNRTSSEYEKAEKFAQEVYATIYSILARNLSDGSIAQPMAVQEDAASAFRKLTELRESGYITEKEFEVKRKEIIDNL